MTRPSTCHHQMGWFLCKLAFTTQHPKSISEIWDLHPCTDLHVVSRTNFEVWKVSHPGPCRQSLVHPGAAGHVLRGCHQPEGLAVTGPFSSPRPCLSLFSLPAFSPYLHLSCTPLAFHCLHHPSSTSLFPCPFLCFGFPSLFTPCHLSPQPDSSEAHRRHGASLRLMAGCPHSWVCAASSCIPTHFALRPPGYQLLHVAYIDTAGLL